MTRWGKWIFACVLPQRDLEAVIGDLAEEYVLRSHSDSGWRVARWYWGQISRSIPPLVWASVRRGGVLATLGAAVAACIVQATVEVSYGSAMTRLLASDVRVPGIVNLIVGLMVLVLAGYLAAWLRPGAATVLAAIVMIAILVILMVKEEDSMPLLYRLASLVLGPLASLAGGFLCLRKQPNAGVD